jgi:hypothetical protein
LVLGVTPQPPASVAPVALHVTSPNDWPCVSKYIDADGSLVDTPVFQLPDEWDTTLAHGLEIVPSSEYHVVAECGVYESDFGAATTWRWGDMDNDGDVDFFDINLVIDGWRGIFTIASFEVLNIASCPPNTQLDFFDIAMAIDAWKELPYPCSLPCP